MDENTDENVLLIADITSNDSGTYTVTASNEHGSKHVSVTLIVTDKLEEVVDWKAQLKHRLFVNSQL